ncbi:methylthioribose kinase [Nitratireductor aquibiodomus RA22]|uniref:S-methyl-5-thioribose kinase n=1 Tax=Nitratireductor aquibiodomus RA22 TaxID=1189611 RepID=I5C2S9_9HYPH|nr:S-methyl-5-thioribose kinase [Nitratireductor aquibiodomus]EIM76131.1 methylthioribose kinase [Nitratireductor aquibiodomus RA22]
MKENAFEALTVETLPERLGNIPEIAGRLGGAPVDWKVREVGDGNLNLVFIVEGGSETLIIKQALPYVRLVGDSWPLPLKRSFFEYHALTRQEERAPGTVPAVHYFDETQALIAMEFLSPHIILRRALIEGQELPKIGRDLGLFMARTLFRGSDLSMKAADRKADLVLFSDNVDLCDITENLVFSDPYYEAPMNRHTPGLDALVKELRADRDLKVEAQRMKHLFASKAETMVHGDLHSGSVMVTPDDTRIIDPEFAFYGPMAFDVGMLIANYWMAYFSQRGHEQNGSRASMRAYLLRVIEETWSTFRDEFAHLWRTERSGILYQAALYEDQDDGLAAEQALNHVIHDLWTDMLGFAGIEMHRRILGLAHNADFEDIADESLRASCEAPALKFGRHIVVNRNKIQSLAELDRLAEALDQGKLS